MYHAMLFNTAGHLIQYAMCVCVQCSLKQFAGHVLVVRDMCSAVLFVRVRTVVVKAIVVMRELRVGHVGHVVACARILFIVVVPMSC